MAILAVKSLVRYLPFSFTVTIIEDGSFSPRDKWLVQHHLKGVKVITKSESDAAVKRFYGRSSKVFEYNYIPYVRKKSGIQLFSKAKRILICDSDILLFKASKAINDWAKGKTDCIFLTDIANSYFISAVEVKHYFNIDPIPQLNSGFVGLPREAFDAQLLEKVVQQYHDTCTQAERPPQMQVYFAILFAQLKEKGLSVVRLPKKTHVVSPNAARYKHAVLGHYVRSVRAQYYLDAHPLINLISHT